MVGLCVTACFSSFPVGRLMHAHGFAAWTAEQQHTTGIIAHCINDFIITMCVCHTLSHNPPAPSATTPQHPSFSCLPQNIHHSPGRVSIALCCHGVVSSTAQHYLHNNTECRLLCHEQLCSLDISCADSCSKPLLVRRRLLLLDWGGVSGHDDSELACLQNAA